MTRAPAVLGSEKSRSAGWRGLHRRRRVWLWAEWCPRYPGQKKPQATLPGGLWPVPPGFRRAQSRHI